MQSRGSKCRANDYGNKLSEGSELVAYNWILGENYGNLTRILYHFEKINCGWECD